MPTIRKLDGPTVAPKAIGGPNQQASVPQGAFDNGASAFQQAGAGLTKASRDLAVVQDQWDEAEAKKLDAEFSAELRKVMHGDGDTPGYFGSKGGDAMAGYKSTEQRVNELRQEYAERGGNANVKRMFSDVAERRTSREFDAMARHVSKERTVAANAASAARMEEAAQDAAAKWNDPDALRTSVATARQEAAETADRNGLDGVAKKSAIEKAETVVHVNVIEAMLAAKEGDKAKEYFDANRAKMDGNVHAAVEEKISDIRLMSRSQTIADEAMGQANPQKWIRDNYSGEEEKLALSDVNTRLAEADKAKARNDRDLNEQGEQIILGGGVVQDLTPEQRRAMGPSGISSALSAQKAIAERGSLHKQTLDVEALQAEDELQALMQTPEGRQKLAGISLLNAGYAMRMTEEQYDRWNSQIRVLIGANVTEQRRLADLRTKQAPFNAGHDLIKQFGADALSFNRGKKASESQVTRQNGAIRAMTEYVQRRVNSGKEPTPTELAQEATRILLEVQSDPDGLFNSFSGLAFEAGDMTPEQRAQARVDIDEVPPDVRAEIVAEIEASGLTPTDDLIEQLAGAYAVKDAARARELLRPLR